MTEFFASIIDWFVATRVPEQINTVDIKGLFQNSYFLVPFIGMVIYFLYKQAVNNLIITALAIFLWWFSGTDFVRGAVVGGELQLSRVLPVAGVGMAGLAILVYLLFIKQD
jgi:hypothetical protein